MDKLTRSTGTWRGAVLALLCALVLGALPATVPVPAHALTAIETEHQRLGGASGRLGAPLAPERCGLPHGGCYRSFERGSIHWSARTGARATWGAIRSAWAATGWERGRLGYPVGGEVCGLRDGGCYQSFERGSIHWSPRTGAHPTWGAIRSAWAATGWERGRLGYPVGREVCGLRDGGCYQSFERGSIHWSPRTGAHPTWGAIRSAWAATGWERGRLGYPVGGEVCGLRDGGCYQSFERGSIHWSPPSGAHPTWGAIRSAWAATGWERGALGYPTGTERCADRSCRQSFQRGSVTWTNGGGIRVAREIDRAASVFVVVNKRRPLSPVDHVPGQLESVGGHLMRADAAAAFRRMQADAAAAGAPMTAVSGYRSYATQDSLYRYYVSLYGQAQADLISARPGHSEHQTGLVMDIGTPSGACGLQECFAGTPAGAWARAHAHRYGFIVRYPAGHTATTGYSYEPWHLRYVGRHVSTGMARHGIPTLEHYMRLPAAPTY